MQCHGCAHEDMTGCEQPTVGANKSVRATSMTEAPAHHEGASRVWYMERQYQLWATLEWSYGFPLMLCYRLVGL
jgi:hypothetical protein